MLRLNPVIRSFNFVLFFVLLATAAWTFKVKFDSREAYSQVIALEKKIKAQEAEIDLLKSDWSLLTSPARLEKLVEQFGDQLQLEQVTPAQVSDENNLPPRINDQYILPQKETHGYASIDEAITGSVKSQAGQGEQ